MVIIAQHLDYIKPRRERLHAEWESVFEHEKRSRTVFAQETIKFDIITQRGEGEFPLLAEGCRLFAFAGALQNA